MDRSELALREFLQRVWRQDVEPWLRDAQRAEQERSARRAGQAAATAGLALDALLRLRGRPFTRMLTVLGTSLGAIAPRTWSWRWLRQVARGPVRERVVAGVQRGAGGLSAEEARRVLGVADDADAEHVRQAWRRLSARWHPDRARDDATRAEHHVRFVAYHAAYDRLKKDA